MPLIDLNGLGYFKGKENAMVAGNYSASNTYAVGDYVYYSGTLYRCTTAITTAEAWTAAHWTAAKLADDLTSQSEKIKNLNLFPFYNYLPDHYEDTHSGRKIVIEKNNITLRKVSNNTTYTWWSLFGAKYIGTGSTLPTTSLSDDDFLDFSMIAEAKLTFSRWCKNLRPNNTGIITFYAITKNSTTGVISSAALLNDRFGQLRKVDLFSTLPQISENLNFGLCIESHNASYENDLSLWLDSEFSGNPIAINQFNMVARQNYAINSFFLYGNNLYRVIAPISNGETITVGTNVVQTSVSEELSSLLNS